MSAGRRSSLWIAAICLMSDYIKQNNITETPANHDDPEVPEIVVPILPGWEDAGQTTPDYAYNAAAARTPFCNPTHPPSSRCCRS